MTHKNKQQSRKARADGIGNLLRRLQELRRRFDRSSADKKLALLQKLGIAKIIKSDQLLAYHDNLSFMRAYPGNAHIFATAERELQDFGKRVEYYRQHSRDHEGQKLLNSGMANTLVWYAFGYETCRHLLKWYPKAVEIDWDNVDEDADYNITDLLQLLVAWQENDAIDNDWTLDTREWFGIARGRKTRSSLETLCKLFAASVLPHNAQEYLFEKLELPISWDLTNSPASRSAKRLPSKKIFYQRKPLRGRTPDLRAELAKPPAPLRPLSSREGHKQVRSINEVLAVRTRELQPLTYANPKEVYLYEPGRGVQIFIYGARPEIRLPLESNFGAMLVRNGLPVGYGVGATLFDRVEIAINVFPAFRSGESSFIIEHFFKLFHHHFGSNVLLVRSRQMGDGDNEPLQSGAFWFYYKLGFRAIDPKVRRLAEEEHEVIRKNKGYRSPLRTLKRLAKSDVFFHVDPSKMDSYREFPIVNLGYVVTKFFADEFDGNRNVGSQRSMSEVGRRLGIRGLNRWSTDEVTAFERMAPLLANIPDLEDWTVRERASLVRIIRAKGSIHERGFLLLSNRHSRFKAALEELARCYDSPE
jgi:hypothetical protein